MALDMCKIPIDGFPVGEDLDVAVSFTTPEKFGQHVSFWQMSLPSGERFGEYVTILLKVLYEHTSWLILSEARTYKLNGLTPTSFFNFVQVDTSLESSTNTSYGLNLNLPA